MPLDSQDTDKTQAELLAEIHALRAQLSNAETQHRRAEEALYDSERRYELASQAGQVGLWDWNLATNAMHLDPTLKTMLGYGYDDIRNHIDDWRALIHPDDIDAVMARIEAYLSGEIPMYEIEHRMLHKDGSVRWFLARATVIRDADGTPLRLIGTTTNITDYRRLEAERDRLFTLSIDLLCVAGFDGYLRQVNPAFQRLLGWSVAELLDIPWLDLVHPDDKPQTIEASQMFQHGQPALRFENRYRCKDGSYRWLEWNSFPLPDEQLIFAVARDITDQKTVERIIAERDLRYQNIIDSSPLGMHMYQLEPDGRLVFTGANPSAEAILGVNHDPFIGLTIEEAFPPLAGTEVPMRYRQAAADGIPWLAEQIDYAHGEIQGAFEVYAFQSSPGKMVATFQDITQRKRTEETLRRSEQEKATVLNAMSELVTYQDLKHIIVWANRAAGESVGMSPSELIGRKCHEIWHRHGGVCENCPVARSCQTGQPEEGEITTPDKRIYYIRSYPVTDATGKLEGVVELAQDVTERRQLEQQNLAVAMERERGNVFQQFINNASHDLNTPLTTLKTSLYVLRRLLKQNSRPPTDDERHDLRHIEIMEAQAERLERLWHDMLQMSRLEMTTDFNFTVLDMNRVVQSIVHECGDLAERSQHTLSFTPEADLPPVRGDPVNLDRALAAIVANALHYTPPGGTVEVRTRVENDSVCIEVQDNGIGIGAEDLPHIFEHFYRVDEARNTKTGGGGLGLAIAKKVIDVHGGRIQVESAPGEGSTFQVLLPVSIAAVQSTGPKA